VVLGHERVRGRQPGALLKLTGHKSGLSKWSGQSISRIY
jgi:hypothetical protein